MSDVKRFHWGKDLNEVKGGDYVLASDYDALAAQLAEAERVRAAAIYEASDARMERDARQAQVAELELLTTRDDYEALERQVSGLEAELTELRSKVRPDG